MTSQQFNESDHPRGQAGQFTEKPATDPGTTVLAEARDFLFAETARGCYESAATAIADTFGDGWPLDSVGIPQVFTLDGDPYTLRVTPGHNITESVEELAEFAARDINTYFGPQYHSDGYDGPAVFASTDPTDPAVVRFLIADREHHECPNCCAILHSGLCEDDFACPGDVDGDCGCHT